MFASCLIYCPGRYRPMQHSCLWCSQSAPGAEVRDLDFEDGKRRSVTTSTVVSQEKKQALKRNETLVVLVRKNTGS